MMIYYRLSLLILICLSYLTCPSLSLANPNLFTLDEIEKKEKKIAQGVTNNSQALPSTSSADSDYNQAMQAGYKATEAKDYEVAQTQFKKALQARPNDIYAQQALQNIEFYIARQSNPLGNLTFNSLVLWLGLVIILVGIGIGIWLFLRRVSAYSQDKLEEELLQPPKLNELESQVNDNKDLEPIKTVSFNDNNQDKLETKTTFSASDNNQIEPENSPEVVVENPDSEEMLAIQKTTRLPIPSGDQIETLLEQLEENDPKKRRQAIWKLAQTADSRAMKYLVDLMIETDSQERSLILEALSQISTRTLKPMNHALTLSLQDKNPQVRKNAIRDLTRIQEFMSQIYQLLCHTAVEDSDREVQETAKWAINQLNTQTPPRLDIMTGESASEVTVEQSYSDTID